MHAIQIDTDRQILMEKKLFSCVRRSSKWEQQQKSIIFGVLQISRVQSDSKTGIGGFPTSPFTILDPRKPWIDNFFCSTQSLCDRF